MSITGFFHAVTSRPPLGLDGDRPPSGGPRPGRWEAALWCLAALITLYAAGLFGFGCLNAWWRNFDGDMQVRAAEYDWFRDGVYPNRAIEPQPPDRPWVYTVYPPYALPLFAVFFEPGGLLQGRFVVEVLSLLAYVAMGVCGHRALARHGAAMAALGAVVGAGIAANGTAITVGQFSILCAGCIALQMVFIAQGRPVVAGGWWALAMLKPQIGLPFVLLFMIRRQQLGTLFGALVLVGLSLLACVWTEVLPDTLIQHWRGGMSMKFAAGGYGIGPGTLANAFGLNFRMVQLVCLCTLVVLALALTGFVRRHEEEALLPLAGACAVVGMFITYHRHYDNVMLFPTLLASLHAAAVSRRPLPTAVAVAILLSLVVPKRVLELVPFHESLQAAVWLVAAIVPIWVVAKSPPETGPSPATVGPLPIGGPRGIEPVGAAE
jgi:hypothetical protein